MLDRHALKGRTKKVPPIQRLVDFAIENQRELREEHRGKEFPEWNKGYLEALLDARQRYRAATFINEGPN